MAEELVDGIRPLSSFPLVEQRLILALVRAKDVEFSTADLAEIEATAREAAREATVAFYRDRDARRALPTTRRASPPPLH